MEFPPTDWFIFPSVDFDTSPARSPGELGVELMLQVRPNGRVVDHWRLALGGSRTVDVEFQLTSVVPAASELPSWRLAWQIWPHEIQIRRNMTSSTWVDLLELIEANEMQVSDSSGSPVLQSTVVSALKGLQGKPVISAALRWAVCVSAAEKLELQLQALPASASSLSSKPIFKRYLTLLLIILLFQISLLIETAYFPKFPWHWLLCLMLFTILSVGRN